MVLTSTLELLPFLASIYLELISPLSSARMKKIVRAHASSEKLDEDIIQRIETYGSYSADASQIGTAFFLTIATALSILVSTARVDAAVPLVLGLVAIMLTLVYYSEVIDPYKWSAKVLGKGRRIQYSIVSVIGIALNLVLIILLVFL
jgi:hypothetical protein